MFKDWAPLLADIQKKLFLWLLIQMDVLTGAVTWITTLNVKKKKNTTVTKIWIKTEKRNRSTFYGTFNYLLSVRLWNSKIIVSVWVYIKNTRNAHWSARWRKPLFALTWTSSPCDICADGCVCVRASWQLLHTSLTVLKCHCLVLHAAHREGGFRGLNLPPWTHLSFCAFWSLI